MGETPAYTQHKAIRFAGKIGRIYLWMRAMAISGVIWSFSLCFLFMGIALPWKSLTILNWGLIGTGLLIGYGAYRFDRMVWRAMRKRPRAEISISANSEPLDQGHEITHAPEDHESRLLK